MNPYNLPRTKKVEKSGIYFLIDQGTIVYIGKSQNVVTRTTQHKDKKWDEYSYITCHFKDLNRLEKMYIKTYSPKYNEALAYKKVPILNIDYQFPELENNQGILENNQFYFKRNHKYICLNLVYNKDVYQFQGYKGYIRIKEKYGEIEIGKKSYFIITEKDKLKLQSKF